MSTKIIVLNPEYAPLLAGMGTASDETSKRAAGFAQYALAGTQYSDRRIMTMGGLATVDTFERIDPEIQSDRINLAETPRVLEAIGAILIDDLSDEDEAALANRAQIFENVEIELIAPVDATVAANQEDYWHLDKVWGDDPQTERGALNGAGVTIGILDTGIDGRHPEFAGKSISFQEFDASGFFVPGGGFGFTRDAGNHGTHVSAIAAGKNVGVAPAADLAVAAVLTQVTPLGNSGTLAQILAGYNWLAHANHVPGPAVRACHIINASLGAPGYWPYLYSSVEVLFTLQRALLVAAIGNSGRNGHDNHGSPGNYDIVLGVGATDANDHAADFSDWGLETTNAAYKPDMSAPGVSILSAVPGGGYQRLSGTSMAAPMVSGAAALILQKYPGVFERQPRSLSDALIRAISTATNNAPENRYPPKPAYSRIGAGRLNLGMI
jgi:subtilisin family serine protease